MIQMVKIKYNKESKEEEYFTLDIDKKNIACLYRDRNGVFIVTTQGFIHKVPYSLDKLKEVLEM